MKYLTVGTALACVITLAACTEKQKCYGAKLAYDTFANSDRGGAAEKAEAKKQFEAAQKRCAANGIKI